MAYTVADSVFETLYGDVVTAVAGYRVSLVTPAHQKRLGAEEEASYTARFSGIGEATVHFRRTTS